MSDATPPGELWCVDVELEWFTILHRFEVPTLLHFEIYQVAGRDEDGSRVYRLASGSSISFTSSPFEGEAERWCSGTLRFDGCVNYAFDQEECSLHECGRGAFRKHVAAFERVYDLAAAAMPKWADYLV